MAIYSTNVKRPRYFDRQQLAAQDLALEQHYHIARTKQLNQHLHGWGVVCGAMLDIETTGQVSLSEGFAISPSGCSIYIPAIPNLDFAPLLEQACGDDPIDCEGDIGDSPTRAPEPDELPRIVYLIARPIEQATDPRPAIPADCSHQGNNMEYSRTCESVCLEIVCELPDLHQTEIVPCDDLNTLFCARENANIGAILHQHFACPQAVSTEQDYVVLATLITQIMPNERRRVIDGIRYDSRRLLLPTQTLQHYFSCLCNRPTPTPTITRTPTPTRTIRPTRTITPTVTFTRLPTQTFTRIPTPTFTRLPTQTITRIPTLTITRFPTELPTGFPTRFPTEFPTGLPTRFPGEFPIGSLTRPVDPLIIEGMDIFAFDPIRGLNANIDELVLIGENQKSSLREMGIETVLDLYVADTSEVAAKLSLSEVRVAEYRDNALASMRRGSIIALDDTTFDIEKGMRASVEEVHNVGRTRGEKLTNAGYASVADIANAQPDTVAEILSVSPKTANLLIGDAQNRMRRP